MEPSKSTILVTGGCGFLGSHIVDALVGSGYHVVAISRNPRRYLNGKATYMACDVFEHKTIAAIVNEIKPIAIIHTVTPGPFAPESLHRQDLAATKNLVAVASKCTPVRAFVYAGSVLALSNMSGASSQPLTEAKATLHTSATATSVYANTKSASELAIMEANCPALATAVLRLPAIFGPRETEKSEVGISFARAANTFATRIQLGNNSVVHDWLYVENAARAHVLAVEALLRPRESAGGEAYFITDGSPIRLWDFVRRVWTAAGDESCNNIRRIIIPWWAILALATMIEYTYAVFTLGRVSPPLSRLHVQYMMRGSWFDIGKSRERLGYEPLVSTGEGIKRTVAWFNASYSDAAARKLS